MLRMNVLSFVGAKCIHLIIGLMAKVRLIGCCPLVVYVLPMRDVVLKVHYGAL
jgi:hypothetical protein